MNDRASTDSLPFVRRDVDARGVVTLTLDRPQSFNALSEGMLAALQAELDAVATDERARAVVIAATGKAFCAGHDLKQMRADPSKAYYEQLFAQCARMALFTYFIPAAFLAVPMYKTMANYGLLNNRWSLVLAMVTIASPYCIWVLKQASDKLPWELDEAARIDGATPWQLFRLVYMPLMVPSLVAVGTYALLLAWNEYLYGFLLLSNETDLTLAVALGNFLAADDSPWELLMATGLIYAVPPAAIYYAFKRYMPT